MTTHPPRKRILLAIGDVGGGHRSAAAAHTRAVEERYAAYEVVTEDFFAFVDPSPFGDSNRAQRLFARHAWLKVLVNDPVWHLSNTRAGNRWTERFVVSLTDVASAALRRYGVQASRIVAPLFPLAPARSPSPWPPSPATAAGR